jgi:predicted RNA-binding Zn ribbon-like protein
VASESSRLPDDDLPAWEPDFRFTSGRLCLAFCATVGERWRNFERLRSPSDLARWVVATGLLRPEPAVTEPGLADARVLREAVYRAIRVRMAGKPVTAGDREMINEWARQPDPAPQIAANGIRTSVGNAEPLAACLSSIARDAIELLSGPDLDRVRECAAPDCALLFLDRSRPGKRRWCADRACGSRTRSASYRRRHKITPAAPDRAAELPDEPSPISGSPAA